MTTTFATTAGLATAGQISTGVMARITAAVAGRLARAKARHEYRQMLALEDHILRDIGVGRAEVRRAFLECGGRD